MASPGDSLPTDLAAAHALIIAQREALIVAEAKAQNAEAEARHRALLIEQMKFTIAKLRHEKFGQSSERGALLEQLELGLADLEEDASEAEARAQMARLPPRARRSSAGVRTAQAGATAATRASAARTHCLSRAFGLSVLRRGDLAQDRRGRDRDAGADPAPVEGDPTRAREVLLPVLRERSRSRLLPPTRSRAGALGLGCSRMSCSPSTACICRFCDRAVVVNTSRSTSRAKLLSVVGVNRHMMRSKKG